ncbi:hypothetical protein PVAND_017181 [Polypedilum vanderplanki]|uniref:Gustatory receptor n=1 Tax=Polypedilum vanderplanki TaxID=319348 RepID=A0A9J6BIC3_POLVA|nr:hypothetical protein PVAND_017181 [Polypedilum vanderplanki]
MTSPPAKIKAFVKQSSIWDLVGKFQIAMKVFGFANFTIDGKIEDGKIKTTFVDIIIAFATNSLIFYLIYLNYNSNLSLISTNSKVIDIGSRVVLLFEITNVFATSIIMFVRRHQLWGIFSRCHRLDGELSALGMIFDHKKQHRNFFLASGLSILVFLLMSAITVYFLPQLIEPERSTNLIVSYLTINASMTISLLTIAFLLFALYQRFELINSSIRHYFVTEEEDEMKPQKPSKVLCKIIAKLADLHDTLVDIVGSFNSCFTFQLMNVIAAMFMTNIFSIFAIYRVFVRYDYGQYERAIIQYAWNCYFLLYGLAIITLASLVTRTGKYTAVIVHKAVNYIFDDDDPVIDYLKMFSQQMQHRAPVVTCKLFTFDFTLLFTIIGATATYIVVLIQFDTDVTIPNKNSTIIGNFTNSTY